mgnify:CR=1 FL=1
MSKVTAKKVQGNNAEIKKKKDSLLTMKEAITQASEIIEKTRHCLVATNGDDGYPNIKTMTNRKHDGFKTIWFATDTSSNRVQQLKRDKRACVYCLDAETAKGLMLVGDMEILHDIELKRMIWIKGEEKYNPLGVEDPEWCLLRFTAKRANVVDAMQNKGLTFEIE